MTAAGLAHSFAVLSARGGVDADIRHPPLAAGAPSSDLIGEPGAEVFRSIARMPGRNSPASVTTAPSAPAPTSVACTPIAALTGPVRAKDSGRSPIEISQSRL